MCFDERHEKALRTFLEKMVLKTEKYSEEYEIELNVVKPLTSYIRAEGGSSFVFSYPMFAIWELTSGCNFRCIHCLYNESEYISNDDLTDIESLNLADTLIEKFGITEVLFTGGEIFLRKNLLKNLIEKFKANNVGITLLTNAALMNDDDIDFLSKTLNPYTDRIQISLDGATAETFKKIRQTDSFYTIVDNIKKLVKSNMRVTVVFTVNSINYQETVDAYELCEKLGINEFVASRMKICNPSHIPLVVDLKELLLIYEKLYQRSKQFKTKLISGFLTVLDIVNTPEFENILNEGKYLSEIKKQPLVEECSCNLHDRIAIKANGNVYMCLDAECPNGLMGNIKEKPISEIWENRHSNIFFQSRTFEKMGCGDCKYMNICNGGCMARAYKRTGYLNSPEINCKYLNNN